MNFEFYTPLQRTIQKIKYLYMYSSYVAQLIFHRDIEAATPLGIIAFYVLQFCIETKLTNEDTNMKKI